MTEYQNLLSIAAEYYGIESQAYKDLVSEPISSLKFYNAVKQLPYVNIKTNASGEVISYTCTAAGHNAIDSNIGSIGNSNTVDSIYGSNQTSTQLLVDSPVTTGQSGYNSASLATATNASGNVLQFVTGSVIPAIAAVGTGISLGKAFDSVLYNANPDFWDSHGMSSLNPEKWSSITEGQDGVSANLFNMIFGIDQTTKKTQAYLPQEAFAYLAYWMQLNNVFGDGEETFDISGVSKDYLYNSTYNYTSLPLFRYSNPLLDNTFTVHFSNGINRTYYVEFSEGFWFILKNNTGTNGIIMFYNDNAISGKLYYHNINGGSTSSTNLSNRFYNFKNSSNGVNIAYYMLNTIDRISSDTITIADVDFSLWSSTNNLLTDLAYFLLNGTIVQTESIEGITTQPNASTPVLVNSMSLDEVLAALQQQYPGLFSNAITNDVVQPDGSTITTTYIPIAWPESNSKTDNQPVSGRSTQAIPEIDPDTATEKQISILVTTTSTDGTTEAPDTGEGDGPPIIIPGGTAQALWSLYNPSISQLNTFASWLWSSDFVDQLLKVFNDPMQSIIGLHKVFLQPSNGEDSTIAVGYLNSQVPSKTVNKQYTSLNCGSIDLYEYFGNVFDYSPYTQIHLYLPFVGIVELDTADIMRSTVTITYNCDVITGDILVEVNVKRDNAGGVLYCYNGNCAVKYPLSSGSYLGMVTGALAATASFIQGNPLGTMYGIASMHTNVEHSGSFKGNSGAMGSRKPYFIISRPQTAMPDKFESIEGIPSNYSIRLGTAQGFIRCKDFHLEGIPLTNQEKNILSDILKEGIII